VIAAGIADPICPDHQVRPAVRQHALATPFHAANSSRNNLVETK
jgi:hypothetical protein